MFFDPGMSIVQGRYKIVDLLGKGGFGEVYKAYDTRLELEVAVKVIKRSGSGSSDQEFADYEMRFKQEAKVGAQIRDDNVIAVYDLAQHDDNTDVLVTEYAPGGSLTKRIATAAIPFDQAIVIAAQICKGVAALHRPPLSGVHRDIKPSNILFDTLGRAKVADFGLVETYGLSGGRSQGMGGSHPGTPGYMSPEQEKETGYLTPASDVYSLGCVLFEMLTQQKYQQCPRGTKVSNFGIQIPLPLEVILDKALSVDPDQRYQNAEEMQRSLEQLRNAATNATAATPQVATVDPRVFLFRSGEKARSPEEWAKVADKQWSDGVYQLSQTTLEQWLSTLDRNDLAAQVAEIRKKQNDNDIALEQVINLLDPTVEQPKLYTDATAADFGKVEHGERRSLKITVANRSRGLLYGQVTSRAAWLRTSRTTVKCKGGQTVTLDFTFDSSALTEGEVSADPAIEINTNGGQATFSAKASVTWAPSLNISPGNLNFGECLEGEPAELRQQTLTIRNTGGGCLQGTLGVTAEWLGISPRSFSLTNGEEVAIQVSADPALLPELANYRTEIDVQSSAGARTVGVRISHIAPKYKSDVRGRTWSIYLLMMAFAWAGWSIPLAVGANWLLNRLPDPPVWQLVILSIWPIAALIIAIWPARRLVPRLDDIENFYHHNDLATDIPARSPDILRQIILGVISAAGVLLLANGNATAFGADLYIRAGNLQLPRMLISGLAAFLFGLLLLNPRKMGRDYSPAERWTGILRTLLMGVLAALVYSAVWGQQTTQVTNVALAAAIGLLAGADSLAGLPLRLHWLLAQAKPVFPAILMLGLFFDWARTVFNFASVTFGDYYTYHTIAVSDLYGFVWWRDFLFVLALNVVALVSVSLDTTVGIPRSTKVHATLAALMLGGLPVLVAMMIFRILSNALLSSTDVIPLLGVIGMLLVGATAAVTMWLVTGSRQWQVKINDWLSARLKPLLQRLPGAASRAKEMVNNAAERSGLGNVAGANQTISVALKGGADRAAGAVTHGKLADYLAGRKVIPSQAGLLAAVVLFFATPAAYGFVSTVLETAVRIGFTVVVILVIAAIIVAVVIALVRNASR